MTRKVRNGRNVRKRSNIKKSKRRTSRNTKRNTKRYTKRSTTRNTKRTRKRNKIRGGGALNTATPEELIEMLKGQQELVVNDERQLLTGGAMDVVFKGEHVSQMTLVIVGLHYLAHQEMRSEIDTLYMNPIFYECILRTVRPDKSESESESVSESESELNRQYARWARIDKERREVRLDQRIFSEGYPTWPNAYSHAVPLEQMKGLQGQKHIWDAEIKNFEAELQDLMERKIIVLVTPETLDIASQFGEAAGEQVETTRIIRTVLEWAHTHPYPLIKLNEFLQGIGEERDRIVSEGFRAAHAPAQEPEQLLAPPPAVGFVEY